MDVLVALGTSVAFLFSAAVTIFDLGDQHVYFEASVAIITLVLLGKLLESRAKAGTSAAIKQLIALQPRTAHVIRDGQLADIEVEALQIGERFVVRPGEAIPVDGVVLEGHSSVVEAMLTGEAMPVAKTLSASVFAGTLNQEGLLECRATGVGSQTTLAAIVRLVAEAQGSKAPIQRLAYRVSAMFVPAILLIGSPALLANRGLVIDHSLLKRAPKNCTVVAVAQNAKLIGLIAIADRLRESSRSAVARLKEMGIRASMLTGDNAHVASDIAAAAGITDFQAEVMPADKARQVRESKQSGNTVGMVGDGINDTPALATADVSFAFAAGADMAIHAADITLMRNDMNSVVEAIRLSKATVAKIHQNLFFAFVYNVLGIPLAAFGLLNPVVAGAAMAMSSVSVVSNSLLLKRWRP